MNFILLGVISGLDVLANAFVFSGALRADFNVTEAADFSTVLGWGAVLAAVTFGGAEQIVDHRKFVPSNAFGSPVRGAWMWVAVTVCLFGYAALTGQSQHLLAIPVLALVLGLRSVARSVGYAKGNYRREAVLALAELALLVALTVSGLSILTAYLLSKLAGMPLRINLLWRFPQARIDGAHMWGYSFAAIAPALYFNIYYTALPALVTPEVLVRFRFLQSILVPISFLGSLLARSRIVFHGTQERWMSLFAVPNSTQTARQWTASALLPAALSLIYVAVLALAVTRMNGLEVVWTTLYCTFIYHRAQLYSQITLRSGPVARARVGLLGTVLIVLSLAPIAALDQPSITALYAALTGIEVLLLLVSIAVMMRARAGFQT